MESCKSCIHIGTGIRGMMGCTECKLKTKVFTPWFGTHHPIILSPSTETCDRWEGQNAPTKNCKPRRWWQKLFP